MTTIDVKVEGLAHLRDVLIDKIPAQAREKVVVSALRRSFKPMVVAAKQNAARADNPHSLALSESIKLWKVSRRKKKKKSDTFATVEIGPRRSDKRALARLFTFHNRKTITPDQLRLGIRHGHLVEYGVPSRGIPAQPFLRPAADSKAAAGISAFRKELGRAIDKQARRLAKRQLKGAL